MSVRSMSTQALYICCYGLWKTPVDNSVENVENFDLSTVIPVLCMIRQALRSLGPGLHNTYRSAPAPDVMSPADTRGFLPKHGEKVGAVCKNAVNSLPGTSHAPKFLCNTDKDLFCIDRP